MTVLQPSEASSAPPQSPDSPPKTPKKRRKKNRSSGGQVQAVENNPKPPEVKLNEISRKGPVLNSNWAKFAMIKGKPVPPPAPKPEPPPPTKAPGPPKPRGNVRSKGKIVAIDCEMVGIGDQGKDNMLARVSLVNDRGDCIYDTFVKPREKVVDYRTYVSGVRPEDMARGKDFEVVQAEVAALLKEKILVGHSIKGDLQVLFLSHPRQHIRDTSKYFKIKGKGTPSLKRLAKEYLKVTIQEGEHSSIQDAQAAVHLYNMYRHQWESGGGNRAGNHIPQPKNDNQRQAKKDLQACL